MQEDTFYAVRVNGHAVRLFHSLEVAEYFAKELAKANPKTDSSEIIEENKKVIWKDGEYVE